MKIAIEIGIYPPKYHVELNLNFKIMLANGNPFTFADAINLKKITSIAFGHSTTELTNLGYEEFGPWADWVN